MTRRKFLQTMLAAAAAGAAGIGWLAKKAAPRKFVRAVRSRVYPGALKTLENIRRIGKWSG